MDYDVAIIGSGFGGSVSALRLSEKGYRVAVLEQGNWVTPEDMEEGDTDVRRLNWMPSLGSTGYFSQDFFRHVTLVRGIGVGGGSIVYAAVFLRPKDEFYHDPAWALGSTGKRNLPPIMIRSKKCWASRQIPPPISRINIFKRPLKKWALARPSARRQTAFISAPRKSWSRTRFLTARDRTGPDAFLCGRCLTGCPHGSKNTLDKNYLYLAQRLGATIFPLRKVTSIAPRKTADICLN